MEIYIKSSGGRTGTERGGRREVRPRSKGLPKLIEGLARPSRNPGGQALCPVRMPNMGLPPTGAAVDHSSKRTVTPAVFCRTSTLPVECAAGP